MAQQLTKANKKSEELILIRRESFTRTLEIAKQEVEKLPARHRDILFARYENIPIQFREQEYFHGEEFAQVIHSWCMLSGIRDFPDNAMMNIIRDFLLNEYSALTLEEISLAMRMNILSEFGEEPINPYNSLDIKFLTTVISKYNIHRKKASQKYLDIKHLADKPPKVELTDFQKDYLVARNIEVMQEKLHFREEVIVTATLYGFLSRIGMLQVPQGVYDNAVKLSEAKLKENYDNVMHFAKSERENIKQQVLDPERFRSASVFMAEEKLAKVYLQEQTPDRFPQALGKALQDHHGYTLEQVMDEVTSIPEYYMPVVDMPEEMPKAIRVSAPKGMNSTKLQDALVGITRDIHPFPPHHTVHVPPQHPTPTKHPNDNRNPNTLTEPNKPQG